MEAGSIVLKQRVLAGGMVKGGFWYMKYTKIQREPSHRFGSQRKNKFSRLSLIHTKIHKLFKAENKIKSKWSKYIQLKY